MIKESEKYKIFSFEASKKFEDLQETFESVRDTHDPNML